MAPAAAAALPAGGVAETGAQPASAATPIIPAAARKKLRRAIASEAIFFVQAGTHMFISSFAGTRTHDFEAGMLAIIERLRGGLKSRKNLA
jgi:hypothetical protein